MLGLLFTDYHTFLNIVIALLVAITIHEFAHAWAADKLGDPTAKLKGRLTLNPLAHLDPIGTIAILITSFGWGKPVPIDPYNLKDPRKDSALISIAGPASNLILAILLAITLRLLLTLNINSILINSLLINIISMCIVLGVFNLLPFHPLDGGKILVGILPENIAGEVDALLSQYGLILLLFFIFPIFGNSSLAFGIIGPIINLILSLLLPTNPLI